MKKKKIVWFAHEANTSGANIAMMEYAEALKADYDFHFVIPHQGNMIAILLQKGFSTSVIPQYGWTVGMNSKMSINKFRLIFRSLLAIASSIVLLKKQNASFVFTNTQVSFIGSVAARICRLPHIWWVHEFGEEDFGFKIGFGNIKKGYHWMQKSSGIIIANSEAVKNKLIVLMPKANIKRLYQPVSIIPSENSLNKKNAFLMFGQIIPSKGHLVVLGALKIIKEQDADNNLELHIYGPCENEDYLKILELFISVNGLEDRVKIEIGFFNKEEIMPQYRNIIIASDAEAFGRVIIEANKYGLKAIVKNVGGAPELINETNGFLYNDLKELVSILSEQKDQKSNSDICLNYDEENEIIQLKKWLQEII